MPVDHEVKEHIQTWAFTIGVKARDFVVFTRYKQRDIPRNQGSSAYIFTSR